MANSVTEEIAAADEAMGYFEHATALRVVSMFQANETGWRTPPVLYDTSVRAPDGYVKAPYFGAMHNWVLHGTAGSNTLAFWGNGGSANAAVDWTLAPFLVPHEVTVYADGVAHDTAHTVFKMIPDGFGCNHTGYCAANIDNTNSWGVEHENLQNGAEPFSDLQLIKSALLYAQASAAHHISDFKCVAHGIVALPWGRRSDPFAGPFNIARWWEHVQGIRREARIWQFWGLPQPAA